MADRDADFGDVTRPAGRKEKEDARMRVEEWQSAQRRSSDACTGNMRHLGCGGGDLDQELEIARLDLRNKDPIISLSKVAQFVPDYMVARHTR